MAVILCFACSNFMHPLIQHFEDQKFQIVELLGRLVEMESPSTDKPSIDRLVDFLADLFSSLDSQTEVVPQDKPGNHLLIRFSREERARQILVLGHTDTVWPLGTIQKLPFRVEGGRVYGPGVFDMKASIAALFFALKAIRQLDLPMMHRVVALLDSDEEIGSHSSRALIEREARRSDFVLVLEPSLPDGALKTSRKGVGLFRLKVIGKAAHAGVAPEKGVNAIEELSHQVLKLQGMNDAKSGTTVTVGVVAGGTRSNVVPAEAEAEIDVRVASAREGEALVKKILGLKPTLRGAKLEVAGGMNRPPMERTSATAALFDRARRIAADMGIKIKEGSTGGGSDGNFTAALGIPTLDGLGVVGDGPHANDEHIVIDRLPERLALLTRLLCE